MSSLPVFQSLVVDNLFENPLFAPNFDVSTGNLAQRHIYAAVYCDNCSNHERFHE
jgi:hypothetical protein